MAKKPKTAKPKLDRAQEKARRQKRLAAVLGVFLVLVLVYEVPHTMKLMNKTAKAPVVTSSATAPAASTPTSPAATPSASTPAASSPPAVTQLPAASSSTPGESGLVASVQVTPGPGQLTQFERFASKDPFSESVQKTGTASTPAGSSPASPAKKQPSAPKAPPAPPPTAAVISLNGALMSVSVGTQFPTAGATFDHAGSLFQLDTLTKTTAKVSIVGGSYADGSPALTLTVGKAVTLQNTADGTRYTLILEPQGTVVPTSTTPTSTSPTTTTPTTTTSVVPSSSGG